VINLDPALAEEFLDISMSPYRRYQRIAKTTISGGNRNPANGERRTRDRGYRANMGSEHPATVVLEPGDGSTQERRFPCREGLFAGRATTVNSRC
jgi:hypothetical protein